MAQDPAIREVTVAGTRSPVLTAGGQDASEAVVFVHGNPGSGADWTALLGEVGGFARAVAPDMPGFGGADKPRRFDYSQAGYGRHLAGVLEELGIARAHLVLHDFGSQWGLDFVLQQPQMVGSVSLIGIGAFRDYRWHRWARMWRTPVLGELVQYTSPAATARLIMARESPRLNREQLDRLTAQIKPYPTRRAILAAYRATPEERIDYWTKAGERRRRAEWLRPLDLPALVLWPTDDPYVPFQPEYQREAFPRAEIHLLEDCGHWAHWEQPELVASLLSAFLRRQLAGPAPSPGGPEPGAAQAGTRSPGPGSSTMSRAVSSSPQCEQRCSIWLSPPHPPWV